jgi:hypothetical protein
MHLICNCNPLSRLSACRQPAADYLASDFAAGRQRNQSQTHALLMLAGGKYFGVKHIQGQGEDNLVP